MNKYLLSLLLAGIAFSPMTARKRKANDKAMPTQSATKTQNGLFTVSKTGNDYFFPYPILYSIERYL